MNIPELFLQRFEKLVPDINRREGFLTFFAGKRPASIRINTLKSSAEDIISYLRQNNISYTPVSWYNNAFILNDIESKKITEFSAYQEGKIYIQSLSSMVPPLILNPSQTDRVLDMTAAPGSKTTHLAMIMGNTGEIIANDIDGHRLYRLRSNIERLGVTNVTVTRHAGQSLWQKYPEYFDRVLLDAPCSMEGRNNFEHWSVKKIKNLAKLQQWLLRSAVSATKPGGIIVYSTCTLAPEENEGVITWILEKEKGAVELEEIILPGFALSPGIIAWEGKPFHSEIIKTKRIYPDQILESFYIARLRKIRSNIS